MADGRRQGGHRDGHHQHPPGDRGLVAKLGWFVALWLLGVGVLTAVGLLIKWVL